MGRGLVSGWEGLCFGERERERERQKKRLGLRLGGLKLDELRLGEREQRARPCRGDREQLGEGLGLGAEAGFAPLPSQLFQRLLPSTSPSHDLARGLDGPRRWFVGAISGTRGRFWKDMERTW